MGTVATNNPMVQNRGLTNNDFQRVRRIIHEYAGIFINEGKEALVQSRLMKRMRVLGITTFSEYLDQIEKERPGGEFLSFVDVLTTNKTSFFRESKHFDYIRKVVLPSMSGRSAKWWSAGCSSGEEPITMGILLHESQDMVNPSRVKILATDLSRKVLTIAKEGVYSDYKVTDVPPAILSKYFNKTPDNAFEVSPTIKSMITYGRLNLTEPWPMKGDFQVIMCRNVMIYFNRKTQEDIIRKFHALLEPGGHLFLGHSESMNAAALGFENVAPAVYRKK